MINRPSYVYLQDRWSNIKTTSSALVQHRINVIQLFCVCWGHGISGFTADQFQALSSHDEQLYNTLGTQNPFLGVTSLPFSVCTNHLKSRCLEYSHHNAYFGDCKQNTDILQLIL